MSEWEKWQNNGVFCLKVVFWMATFSSDVVNNEFFLDLD